MSHSQLQTEMQRRRTFAIISHPDAGKTTFTEKLLLLGGAIRLAGTVKAKKSKKFATSDWMELEKQRGISVSSSVMNFEYKDMACNLLDTPGHQDFSEDTYRTLAATDSAIMLIDAAKGVEPQTIKLFEVCKMRGIPIFTFINKLDREAQDPFVLLEEIEQVLGIKTYPMNWPVGSGSRFRGIVDRATQVLHAFEGRSTSHELVAQEHLWCGEQIKGQLIDEALFDETQDMLDLIDAAGNAFHEAEFLSGQISPVFFGSALTSFGVRLFLENFLKMAPAPSGKGSQKGTIDPLSHPFSGFVFKIQANMDPRHRDRVAFLRVVSGVYEPGTLAWHARLDREIKLSPPQQFFGQERSSAERAYPGDIVGMYDPGLFAIGDSLSTEGRIEFEGIPSFAPEHFAVLRTSSALKRKQLIKGLLQLCQEGSVQLFVDDSRAASDPILAAVGVLQFDVVLFRLKNEYNVDCQMDLLSFKHARWTDASDDLLRLAREKAESTLVRDMSGNSLFLFKNDFHLNYFLETLPQINLFRSNAKLRGNMMKTAASFFAD